MKGSSGQARKRKSGRVGAAAIDWQDPNLSLEELMKGAAEAPWDVEVNISLPLLILEDPSRYVALQAAIIRGWNAAGRMALSEAAQRLCACDYAERVLRFFEGEFAGDLRPRTLIEVARRFALGQASEYELDRAAEPAGQAICMTSKQVNDNHTWGAPDWATKAANWAADAAFATSFEDGIDAAWTAAANAIEAIGAAEAAGLAIRQGTETEVVWQAGRVRFYYQQEHP